MRYENQIVTAKMIIGAESGGQVYGKGKWDYVKIPTIGLEVTLTLGAYQFYGNEGRELLRMIKDQDPELFSLKLRGVSEINESLGFDWVARRWAPDKTVRNTIASIISGEPGIKAQTDLFCDIQLPQYIANAESFGVHDERAQMMWVEIEHVGGLKAAKRIFARCVGDYSLDRIMWSLKQDQNDHSSENQAGDSLYWSRHVFCRDCIEKYAVTDDVSDFDGVYVEVN